MDEATLQFVAAQLRKPEGDAGIQMGERMNEGNRYINEHTIEALHANGNEQILEIGMGNGHFLRRILHRQHAVQYTGCDFSPEMVHESRRRNRQFIAAGQARFLLADAIDLPFEDQSFDKIFTVNTLYFWDNPRKTLQSIRRVLKTSGLLLIAIRPKELMQHMAFVKYGCRMYDALDLEQFLAENGFSIEETINREEPDQVLTSRDVKVATLIVVAKKLQGG